MCVKNILKANIILKGITPELHENYPENKLSKKIIHTKSYLVLKFQIKNNVSKIST